jgi:hypothetical protein
MAGVPAALAVLRRDVGVQLTPVTRLDVLPGLVVSEGGLVAQRRSRGTGGGCSRRRRLGERGQRDAQRQPGKDVLHCSKPCESSARRYRSEETLAPAGKRTDEPHQTSRGGLLGSDGSRWALQAVREEARGGSGERGKHCRGRVVQLRNAGHVTDQGGRRTGCRTEVALVGVRFAVVLRTVVPGRMVGRRMVVGNRSMLMTSVRAVMTVMLVVAAHKSCLAGHRHARRRAGHGNCHRAPDGEQHGKQNQEPDAEELHREKRIRWTVTGRVAATI